MRRSFFVRLAAGLHLLAAAAGCTTLPAGGAAGAAGVSEALPARPIVADSGSTVIIATGVVQHTMFRAAGPWAIHVLDVDRTACWTLAALKADTVAAGRELTSALLARGRTTGDTVAAVNADFFLFSPPGVPTGPHVDDARVITGPGLRPAVVMDSGGRIHLTRLTTRGVAAAGDDSVAISDWNHLPVRQLGVFDERWGARTDSAAGTLQVAVAGDGRVVRSVSGAARVEIPRGGWVLTARNDARAAEWLGSLRPGDRVRIRTALGPIHPVDAVGGFPMLVRDSAPAPVLDSAHVQNLARARHPRTAMGLSREGRRLWLVVVDGRAPGYSAGMTLPELAQLMLELGARDAINLDGGGSSAMAVRRPAGDVQLVNRPSDARGERAVANAVAVVRGCSP